MAGSPSTGSSKRGWKSATRSKSCRASKASPKSRARCVSPPLRATSSTPDADERRWMRGARGRDMSLLQRLFGSVRGRHPAPKAALYDIFLRNRRKDLAKWHHYFDIYERHLAPYRGRAVTVVEIGLWRGGSLRMWREYFGTTARICGIDVDPATAAYEREGYDIFVGDQADRTFLKKVKDELGTIDIVIDDGGHKMS